MLFLDEVSPGFALKLIFGGALAPFDGASALPSQAVSQLLDDGKLVFPAEQPVPSPAGCQPGHLPRFSLPFFAFGVTGDKNLS